MDTDLVHNVLADVLPIPVYVVWESQGAPSELNFGNAIGSTGLAADLVAMDYLTTRGEWQGRRPCVFINDTAIADLAAAHHESREVELRVLESQLLAAVAVHEAAHIAEKGIDLAPASEATRMFADAIAAYSAATYRSDDRPPFAGHGWRWIRACVHLQHRAAKAGYEAPSDLIMDHDLYKLPELESFAYPLHGVFEPDNLIRESIFEINTFRPPHCFAELWDQSVRHWLAQQKAYTPAVSAAIEMLEVKPDEVENVRVA